MKYYENEMDLEEAMLCLDFANTAEWHASDHPTESLEDYPALVQWAIDKHILTKEEGGEFLAAARGSQSAAGKTLEEAVNLREALYRIFVSAANQEKPEPSDLAVINAWSARMLQRRYLETEAGELRWQWTEPQGRLDHLLGPVVVSALNLLTEPEIHRVGQCADDRGCGWLFLDISRNRSRQWCSMESCGNRAKAKRHYQRARQST